MDAFLHALIAFPTVFFTGLLALCVLYWLTVIVGALDLHIGLDHDHDVGDAHHSGVLEFLSIGIVPLGLVVSVLVPIAWLLSMLGQLLVVDHLAGVFGSLAGAALLIGVLIATIPLGALALRPFRAVFRRLDGSSDSGASPLGQPARITSSTCDHTFGTATCLIAGSELLLRVVASRPELRFVKDDTVAVIGRDDERDVWLVAPLGHPDALAASPSTTLPPTPANGAAPRSAVRPTTKE